MQFRQLEYFVAVAAERHFARAAAVCRVSQSSLSASIGKLERELGVTLINRGRTYQGLTPEGERLIGWARRILAEHDAFKHEVAAVQSGYTGLLRLGAVPTASTSAAATIDAFCEQNPHATVDLVSRLPSAEIFRKIADYELDAGLAYAPDEPPDGLSLIPLYRERLVLIGAADLIPDADLLWSEAAAELPLALLSRRVWSAVAVDQVLLERGHDRVLQVQSDSVAALFTLVLSGRWVSIVPQAWLPVISWGTSVRALPVSDVGPQVVVAIDAATPGSPIARAYAAAARVLSATDDGGFLTPRDLPSELPGDPS